MSNRFSILRILETDYACYALWFFSLIKCSASHPFGIHELKGNEAELTEHS